MNFAYKKIGTYQVLVMIFGVLIISLLSVLGMIIGKQLDTLSKYELLEKIDNQACRYLDKQVAVKGSFDLAVDAPKEQPKLVYRCLTGEQTTAKVIHSKPIGAYDFGATVSYYKSNEEAIKYAEKVLNPLRYWGVQGEGDITQNSHFTFLVTDVEKPYFDAYTVKANAVLRVSLPCANANPEVCQAQATEVLNREMKGINVI